MDRIFNNPYRIIGLYAGANEREFQRQMSKLKAYMNASQEFKCECDFSFLPNIKRNQEKIDGALSNLQLDHKKFSHSLFWFINGNHIDETALGYLKSGNIEKAEEIWIKIVNSNENITKYYSSYNNLSTLQMCLACNNDIADLDLLVNAFRLKYQLLSSESAKEILDKVTDGTFSPDPNDLIQRFADDVLEVFYNLSERKGSSYSKVVTSINSIFRHADSRIKSYITEKNSLKPVKEIEDKLQNIKQERKLSPNNSLRMANNLAKEALPIITLLQTIQGRNSYTCTEIGDKVAMEILQCSIDYFNIYKDSNDADPGVEALKVAQKANDFVCGVSSKQRIEENIKQLKEWIEDTPNRQKYNRISKELELIVKYIHESDNSNINTANADNLINRAKPLLVQMKEKIGSYDEVYQNISSIVANKALQVIIDLSNYHQSQITGDNNPFFMSWSFNRPALIEAYKESLKKSWEVIVRIGEMDMNHAIRSRYNENRAIIKQIMKDLDINPEGFWKMIFG